MPTLATMGRTSLAPNNVIQEQYRDLGFKPLNKPEGEIPRLPTQISSTTSNKLGDLQIIYAAWREYAEDLHAEALTKYTSTKSEYDYLVAITANGLDARTVKDKANKVLENPRVQKLRSRLLEAELMVNLLSAKLESYSNALAVLSRELTRRGNINV
jgi:hypothetical protein